MADSSHQSDSDDHREFRLLSDEPDLGDADPLGFDQVSDKLVATILSSRAATPFSLGVEGGWGTGKSSLMGRMERDLRQDSSVTTVWFNAWSAQGASAFEGLIKTVLERLDTNILRRAARRRQLVSGLRLASGVLAARLGIGRFVDEIWEKASADAKTRNELRGLLHEAMAGWRSKSSGVAEDRLLVIFVDDLDRAAPTQVFEIFEAMKLYLDAPGFVFVVGYDQSVVSEAVLEERKYSRKVTGREYIEKIVQVGYRLSPPDDDQATALLKRFTKMSGTTALFGEAAQGLVIERNRRNPRRIKRFLNSFVLLYALDPDWEDLGPVCLVEVLLLDMYFPDFMALFWFRAETDPVSEFLGYRDKRSEILASGAQGAEVDARLRELERLLPEQYPVLVQALDFIGLVERLRESDKWDDVRFKLERRSEQLTSTLPPPSAPPPPPVMKGGDPSAPYPVAEEPSPKPIAATFARALWIQENPGPNVPVLDWLRERGWDVVVAGDVALAQSMLRSAGADVVISDPGKGDDPYGAIDDVHRLRETPGFTGPIIFFTPRITPEARDRAEKVGALVASEPSELERLLAQLVAPAK